MTSPYLRRRLRSIEEAKADADRAVTDYERGDEADERRRDGATERRLAEPPRS